MTLIRRLVPAPLLSLALVVLWLALARKASVGQLVLALALGLAVPFLTVGLRQMTVRVRRPLVVLRYIFTVGYDVIASNLEVAVGVLLSGKRPPAARFVIIPLELREPIGLAVLAMVTTIVPGTVWSELALDRRTLLLHVWSVDDEPAFVARFKARYEAPLREIFE
jgi:multicomponent K+:H+ antiporter subunit E